MKPSETVFVALLNCFILIPWVRRLIQTWLLFPVAQMMSGRESINQLYFLFINLGLILYIGNYQYTDHQKIKYTCIFVYKYA